MTTRTIIAILLVLASMALVVYGTMQFRAYRNATAE